MCSHLSFKISQLQAKNQTCMTTALATLVAALFVTAVLPSLLIQYLYADQQLFSQPPLLQYIPVVSFAVGVGAFLFAAVGNFLRAKRIKFLETQLDMQEDDFMQEDDEALMAEIESLAEKLAEEKKPAKKKTTSKKTAKKSSKKKTAKKSSKKKK